MDEVILLSKVRSKILWVWLIGAGASALILVVISLLKGNPNFARDAWSWFLPLVLPTLGLMIGVVGSAALLRDDKKVVRLGFSKIASTLSIAYLFTLSLTILLEPFSPLSGSELYGVSNYWMGPFQGIVVAALGYLFTSSENQDTKLGESDQRNNE